MAEYIDREAAINAVFEAFADGRSAYIALETVPAADVAPVVRGEWDEYEDFDEYGGGKFVEWSCSECCYIVKRGWAVRDKNICEKPTERFCPNCGARMDGDG